MTRTRRPRLSWFRFFVDDFEGGTATLSAEDTGNYVRCLCAQWGSKSRCAIPADDESLTLICRGRMPSAKVLAKFDAYMIDGVKHLRNQKLADEWADSLSEYARKQRGGKHPRKREESSEDTSEDSTEVTAPEPQPHRTTTTYLPTARTREGQGGEYDRAEQATQAEERALQLQLGSILARLAEHPDGGLSVSGWCKRVSSYVRKDGRLGGRGTRGGSSGVSDFRMIQGIDRLKKCIEDALAWERKLEKGANSEATRG